MTDEPRVPGASPAKPRIKPDEIEPIFGDIHVGVFDLSVPEDLKSYEEVISKIAKSLARRIVREQLLPIPEKSKWMALLHWQDITWPSTMLENEKKKIDPDPVFEKPAEKKK